MQIKKDTNHYCSICSKETIYTKNHVTFSLDDTIYKNNILGSYHSICNECSSALSFIITAFLEEKN